MSLLERWRWISVAAGTLCVVSCLDAAKQDRHAWLDKPPEAHESVSLSPRAVADARAKQRFLQLHFYSEGRGMQQVPGLIALYEAVAPTPPGRIATQRLLRDRWGFVLHEDRPVGLLRAEYRGMPVGVLGCAACHSGKAAGLFIPGLGNKNVDVAQMAREVGRLENLFGALPIGTDRDARRAEARGAALDLASRMANPDIANLTQGLVPVSFIRSWFYAQARRDLPRDMHRAAVKVPALWGYGVKRRVGQFCDGMGDGQFPGWAIAVELASGQHPEAVRRYMPRVEAAESLLADFLPVAYPFEIDAARAHRGKEIFEQRCSTCHGTYAIDASNLPLYEPPLWIPLENVGTDDDRLADNTGDFLALVASSPLRDVVRGIPRAPGYFAPRLVGIWSRFPYLHNGSVPSLAALLEPPERRPPAFSLFEAGEAHRFDRPSVGLTIPEPRSREARRLHRRARRGARDIYDVRRIGQSNRGHPFGTNLHPDAKLDLIEYLKSL